MAVAMLVRNRRGARSSQLPKYPVPRGPKWHHRTKSGASYKTDATHKSGEIPNTATRSDALSTVEPSERAIGALSAVEPSERASGALSTVLGSATGSAQAPAFCGSAVAAVPHAPAFSAQTPAGFFPVAAGGKPVPQGLCFEPCGSPGPHIENMTIFRGACRRSMSPPKKRELGAVLASHIRPRNRGEVHDLEPVWTRVGRVLEYSSRFSELYCNANPSPTC